jgi:outer membrane scaffolding protein for murein synthesis (MipA/OmpV family)
MSSFPRTLPAGGSVLPCLRITLLALVAALPAAALAELSNDSIIGPGVRSRPAYDGAAAQHTEFVPVIRYLGEHWFVRSTQGVLEGGWRTEVAPGLHVGAQLAYEPGRLSGESAFLESRHVPDIKRGVSAGVHLEWDHTIGPVPITLLLRARKPTDSRLGMQADARFSAGVLKAGPVSAGVFTQATWADARSANAFYGIDAQEAQLTGLSASQASSGVLFASAGMLWSVDLAPHWVAVGSFEARRLRGDAARSPLAEREWGHLVTAGLAYKF